MEIARATRRQTRGRYPRVWKITEAVAWTAGILLLVDCAAWYVDSATGSRHKMELFAGLQAAAQPRDDRATIDFTLWSPERIKAFRIASNVPAPPPLAILRIPRIHLEVAILEGTDDAILNRAVGHIEDTAVPGTDGNSAIAGHRDGFFRGLKDIGAGDVIELETLNGKEFYRIERTWIVEPEDVSVLDPTSARSLTLVTCYPFYFLGPAPKRFIVRAVHTPVTH